MLYSKHRAGYGEDQRMGGSLNGGFVEPLDLGVIRKSGKFENLILDLFWILRLKFKIQKILKFKAQNLIFGD